MMRLILLVAGTEDDGVGLWEYLDGLNMGRLKSNEFYGRWILPLPAQTQ
jgi:hypothetical protein